MSKTREVAGWSALALALLMPATVAAQLPVEPLHGFSAGPRGYQDYPDTVKPVSALVQATNGSFYGTTQYGGGFQRGAVFTVSPTGVATILHSFTGVDGSLPSGGLIQATDGNLYGTTQYGGGANSGTVFRMSLAGAVTVLYSFQGGTDGATPRAALVQAADGNLYGTTAEGGGAGRQGTAFRLTLTGSHTVLWAFFSSSGQPLSALIQASDGNFYGSVFHSIICAYDTGPCSWLFKMTPDGAFTAIGGQLSTSPYHLIQGRDGNFYGVATGMFGVENTAGYVFRMTPSGTLTSLHGFTGGPSDGRNPEDRLVEGADGNFYGTTHYGGASDLGTIFRITPAGSFTLMHSFTGGDDGAYPSAALTQAADGRFYGATFRDGGAGLVTIVSMAPDGDYRSAPTFATGGSSDGGVPTTGLVQSADGNFYGTTPYGGAHNNGAVVRITPSGETMVVHAFTRAEGSYNSVYSALIQGSDGNFYGTSSGRYFYGGPHSGEFGTVFRMTPAGTLDTLHRFTGQDGANPKGGLLQASDGSFYGITQYGGAFGGGTVFRLRSDGAFTLLYSFLISDTSGGGFYPNSGLIQAADGFLYGTTEFGGINCCGGTVFRVALDGNVTVIHRFTGAEGDTESGAALMQAQDGYLYGTLEIAGGPSGNLGSIFRMDTSGVLTILHEFTGNILTTPGTLPRAGLIQLADGTFYGTTAGPLAEYGHASGTVFKMTPAGLVTFLHTFSGGGDGQSPSGPLVLGIDGKLYGTTNYGGAYGHGVAFRFNPRFPLAPTVVTAAWGSIGGVTLRWPVVSIATSYNIKRSTAPGAETLLASGVTTTSYIDASVVRGRRYYYTVTAVNQFGESVASDEVSITTGEPAAGDFDGDGVSDIAVFRASTSTWFVRNTSTSSMAAAWGGPGDIPVAADYDGDGQTDIAVFRPSIGTWFIRYTGTAPTAGMLWGGGSDIPVPADYDGDGKADIAVFRPSTGTWYIRYTGTPPTAGMVWGGGGDVPVPADYDGDGKTDIAVFRPSTGTWFIRNTATPTATILVWGGGGDVAVPGDYDADGRSDIAVYRPSTGTWFIRNTATPTSTVLVWGGGGDVPVPADYDGDGRTDIAVFRPSTGGWYLLLDSATSTSILVVWGGAGDVPNQARY